MGQEYRAETRPAVGAAEKVADELRLMAPAMPGLSDILPYLRRIDESGLYSNYGPLDGELRRRIGAQCGADGVALTTNGTSAIELALRAVVDGVDPARRSSSLCLMPSYTFVATAHAVANAGLEPSFLDIDPASLTLTPEIAERAILALDRRPAAIVVVSAFGAPVDFESWERFEARQGIPVVFDAAAAFSTLSSVPSAPVCVSLHATKLPGMGEGGAVLTKDATLAARITAMTGFGFVGGAREAKLRGGNYRVSEYSAAVGLAALDKLTNHLDQFYAIGSAYRSALSNHRSKLAEGFAVDWISSTVNVRVPLQEVDDTAARLNDASVPWRLWWGLGCHTHPAFRDAPAGNLTETERLAPTVIGLPFHIRMVPAQVERVVACLP